jgi:hypothetical protein
MADGDSVTHPVSFIRHLDHPILLGLFMYLLVTAIGSLVAWGFKSAGMPGPATLAQIH